MHISEGVLSGPVLISGIALAAAGTAIGLKKLDYDRIPRAAIRLVDTGEDPDQRRLATAVRPEDADAIGGGHHHRHAPKQALLVVALHHVLQRQDAHARR